MGTRVELGAAAECDDWAGWVIDRDGRLWAPDTWRNGFTVHDLRSWFFLTQEARALRVDIRTARAELSAALEEKARLERERAFYRRQCVAEARLGLALSVILRE